MVSTIVAYINGFKYRYICRSIAFNCSLIYLCIYRQYILIRIYISIYILCFLYSFSQSIFNCCQIHLGVYVTIISFVYFIFIFIISTSFSRYTFDTYLYANILCLLFIIYKGRNNFHYKVLHRPTILSVTILSVIIVSTTSTPRYMCRL